jgi:CP family cyanate transporter-like MFS transporter
MLTAGSVLTFAGMAVGNVLLPPIVKRYFPDRIGTMTAVYVTVMSLGATIPPAVAVPIAQSSGWRSSLGVWALVSVIAALPWIWQAVRHGRHVENLDTQARGLEAAHADIGRRVFRSPIAWSMGLLFAAPTMTVYAMFAWLPAMTTEISGVDSAQAGLLLGVFAVCGLPAALIVPPLAQRLPTITPLLVAALALFLAGYAGFLFAPAAAPLLWTIFVGSGPLLFPLTLTLINLRTRTGAGAVALSGFVQGLGYALGAFGPLIVGLLRDATGGWDVALWVLLGTMVLTAPAFVVLRRPRYLEDDRSAGTADQAAG